MGDKGDCSGSSAGIEWICGYAKLLNAPPSWLLSSAQVRQLSTTYRNNNADNNMLDCTYTTAATPLRECLLVSPISTMTLV
jgi:hypothetical protein